jgi:hypothetical protein
MRHSNPTGKTSLSSPETLGVWPKAEIAKWWPMLVRQRQGGLKRDETKSARNDRHYTVHGVVFAFFVKPPVGAAPSFPAVRDGSQGWLPPRHDCCATATPCEHLTSKAAGACARRFLATPLHEIIPS